jgi:hypothetical protein
MEKPDLVGLGENKLNMDDNASSSHLKNEIRDNGKFYSN